MSFRKSVLFALLLLSSTASMFAATYYVSPYGNDSFFMNTLMTPWATIAKVNAANLRAGDQVYFQAGGTWREMLVPQVSGLYYGSYGSGARPVISGANKISQTYILPGGRSWNNGGAANTWSLYLGGSNPPSQVWFNGVLGAQASSYTLAPNQWFFDGQSLYVYSTVNPSLINAASIEAAARGAAINLTNISAVTIEHLSLVNTNGVGVEFGGGLGGQQTLNDVVITGAPWEAIDVNSGSPVITASQILNNGSGIFLHGGVGFKLDGSIISGSSNAAILNAGTWGDSTITNSTISGNSVANPALETITSLNFYFNSKKVTVSNSVILPNPYQPRVFSYSGITDGGGNVYQSPRFKQRAAPFIVVPFIDDRNNLDVAMAVASVAKTYGCPISYAVNTKLVSASQWQSIAQLQAAGNEIVAHTRSHADLSNNNVLSIQYTGPAATARVWVDSWSNRLYTFLNGSGTPDLSLDLSDTYNGIIDVVNRIPAGAPYKVVIQPNQNYFTPLELNPTDGQTLNIKSGPVMLKARPDWLNWEVEGSKADIAANLGGYQATAFATPFTSSNITVENHIRDAGFASNRNGLLNADGSPDGNWLFTNLDVYNMGGEWLPFAFDATKNATSTAALVEGLGAAGGVMAVYSHGYDEFSLQSWTDLFANMKTLGASCMTMSQATAYVKSKGTLVNDGTLKNWVQTVPLTPNFSSTAMSPKVGAYIPQ